MQVQWRRSDAPGTVVSDSLPRWRRRPRDGVVVSVAKAPCTAVVEGTVPGAAAPVAVDTGLGAAVQAVATVHKGVNRNDPISSAENNPISSTE